MLDFSSTELKLLTLHHVGNKSEKQACHTAAQPYEFDQAFSELFLNYFLNAFKQDDLKKFYHEEQLEFNPVFSSCSEIFSDINSFVDESKTIVEHLYDSAEHPYIKKGEVCLAYFSEIIFEGVITDAIGIYKLENSNLFVSFVEGVNGLSVNHETGFNPAQIDKACLVLGTGKEIGYRLLTINRKKADDNYWHQLFLNVCLVNTSRVDTQNYLNLCLGFSDDVMPSMVEKEEQFEFNSAAIDYFEKQDIFDYPSFSTEVLEPFGSKEPFLDYVQSDANNASEFYNKAFEIHQPEVKKAKRKMKNIIKLDTNIEVKLDSKDVAETTQFIERGYDEVRKMNFYKVYYNHEIE